MRVRAPIVPPSRNDGFVGWASRAIGGPVGRRAFAGVNPNLATLIVLLTGVAAWLVLIFRQQACRELPGRAVDLFGSMCYSDIPLLYRSRGLVDGRLPYFDAGGYPVLEYPVLTGFFLDVLRRIAVLFGAPVGTGFSDVQGLIAADIFMGVNVVVLGLLLLATVRSVALTTPGRPWDAMMLAASPCVVLAGVINWDLLPVALTALGFLAWSRRKPTLAGVLFGLGMAAKLYPLLLLGPLLILCLRGSRMDAFGRAVGGFLFAWAAVNLPVMILAPEQWLSFWTFNSDRSGDFGSIWYVLSLAGHPVPHLNLVNTALLVALCGGIAALIALAPRRPRLGQVAFLVVAAFLMTNKVYSPQYVLWLLPLLILARPKWREWWVFTIGEVVYFVAIWLHLGGDLGPGDTDVRYWAAVLFRLACQGWVVGVVIRDIVRPEHDVLRTRSRGVPCLSGVITDDPAGGVLDHAPDASWVVKARSWLGDGRRASSRSKPAPEAAPTDPVPFKRLADPARSGLRWVVQAWLGSRGLLAFTALVLAVTTGRSFADLIANWDVQHFLNLARAGYLDDPKEMAFFPGLPSLMRLGGAIGVDPLIAGLALSIIASAVAALALYRMGGVWPAVLWLVAPTAVFTFVPYTEALFCAVAFWAWERARRDRWWQAALLAAAACSLRVSGLFLVGALAVMIITTASGGLKGRLRRLPWLVLPLLVLAGFATYLHGLTGSWTAWYTAQAQGWPRGITTPWQSFLNTLPAAFGEYPQWAWMFRLEIVSMAVGLIVTGVCLRRRRWAEASWVGVQVLAFSLSYWFFSVNRAVLLWFPLWLLLGEWIQRRLAEPGRVPVKPFLVFGVLGSIVVMLWWAAMFMTGRWAS